MPEITTLSMPELRKAIETNPVDVVQDAYRNGRTVSAQLEHLSPTEERGGLDAFGRLMRERGFVTRNIPEAGIWSSRASDMLADQGGRLLLTELFARTWRRVVFARSPRRESRAVSLNAQATPGGFERPYYDAMDVRWSQEIAPAVPLSEVVARTEPIEGQDYRALYLTYSAEQLRMFRVGESAEIPEARLERSERVIALKKYGRRLTASYEDLRRMRVDKLAAEIAFMAVQSETDKVAAALNAIINGDGNSGTSATSYNLTTLDSAATAGTLTLKGWLAFKKKLANPYFITTALMQEAVALQLELLNMGSANIPLVGVAGSGEMGRLRAINQTADQVGYGWLSDAPSLKIVGFDNRRSIEQLVEIGGDITETEKFVTSQTQTLVMSEWNGFAIVDPNANIVLDVNA